MLSNYHEKNDMLKGSYVSKAAPLSSSMYHDKKIARNMTSNCFSDLFNNATKNQQRFLNALRKTAIYTQSTDKKTKENKSKYKNPPTKASTLIYLTTYNNNRAVVASDVGRSD